MLAVLDLVARGVISSPFIAVTGDLTELNELFNLYWRRIIPLGQTSSIAFPFHRPHPQKETDKGAVKSVRRFLEEGGIRP